MSSIFHLLGSGISCLHLQRRPQSVALIDADLLSGKDCKDSQLLTKALLQLFSQRTLWPDTNRLVAMTTKIMTFSFQGNIVSTVIILLGTTGKRSNHNRVKVLGTGLFPEIS